jgi:hypothetical protein
MDRGRRLSKAESRLRWRELRQLWNVYDPIGVADAVDDEYEAYMGPHMRLLEDKESEDVIFEHIKGQVTGHIGMTWSPGLAERTRAFVAQSREWFNSSWLDTYV